jgi:hypothetical protein
LLFALTFEYVESNQRLEKARQRAGVRANFARELLRASAP